MISLSQIFSEVTIYWINYDYLTLTIFSTKTYLEEILPSRKDIKNFRQCKKLLKLCKLKPGPLLRCKHNMNVNIRSLCTSQGRWDIITSMLPMRTRLKLLNHWDHHQSVPSAENWVFLYIRLIAIFIGIGLSYFLYV